MSLDTNLDRLHKADLRTPCQAAAAQGSSAVPWLSDDADEREVARGKCAGCPVIIPCISTAVRLNATFGVWGGADFTDPRTRRAIRREHNTH